MVRKRAMKHLPSMQSMQAKVSLGAGAVLLGLGFIWALVITERNRHHDSLPGTQMRNSLPFQSCANFAAATRPPPWELDTILRYRSRNLPSTEAGSPILAATNWEGLANQQHAEVSRAELTAACGYHVFRYRVVGRVVYTDHNHKTNDILKGHRDTFLELLLTALWIYKDFPDVDLWVSFADEPSRCTLDIPVLQYTVIGLNETRQAAKSNMVTGSDGSEISLTQLLTGGGADPSDLQKPAPKFYRGWAFNYPYSWENLSYMPGVLKVYQQCLLERVGHRPSKAKVIWRGGNTGGKKGWGPLIGPQVQALRHPWGSALLNKRMSLALLARSHSDWMDVGLHEIIPELMGPEGSDKHLVEDLRRLLIRPFVPQETWGAYAVQLSIDGHGSPNRLPLQYLQGSSVILKVASPYKDSFEELFKPDVHYIPCKYDLSDFVPRAQHVLERFKMKKDRAQRHMAKEAGQQALVTFNMLGQLDALMYAILKVKSSSKWNIQTPPLTQGPPADGVTTDVSGVSKERVWEVLVLERDATGSRWKSPTLKAYWAGHIRASMMRALAQHFGQ